MEENTTNNNQNSEQFVLDYEGRWKKALADYENYKKDEAKRFSSFARFSKIEAIGELLPLFDMLQRALKEAPSEMTNSPWVEGIRRIQDEFLRFINKNGIRKIDTIGKSFDPKYHEAVSRVGEEGEDVVEEVRSGFVTEEDFIVRPAQVKIGKK